jgi:hypothetical protein
MSGFRLEHGLPVTPNTNQIETSKSQFWFDLGMQRFSEPEICHFLDVVIGSGRYIAVGLFKTGEWLTF